MEHLKLEKAFMKDLLEAYQNQTTTIATLLKRMIDKHL
jgi:predicted transcriptional regulator